MEKQFTIEVPDEIWVDSWKTGKTETYTYVGPESINVLVETTDEFTIIDWSETDFDREIKDNESVVKLEVNDETVAAAHYITTASTEFEYEFKDITNHDGSTHREIVNPQLQDYFDIVYRAQRGFILSPIYKETETQNERIATERLKFVQKYNKAYEFDVEIQEIIDKFIVNIKEYLETMETAYPWRYVSMDTDEIPKIPATLISEFNKLPDLD